MSKPTPHTVICAFAGELLVKAAVADKRQTIDAPIFNKTWDAIFDDQTALAKTAGGYGNATRGLFRKSQSLVDKSPQIQATLRGHLGVISASALIRALGHAVAYDQILQSDEAEVLLFESIAERVGSALENEGWLKDLAA